MQETSLIFGVDVSKATLACSANGRAEVIEIGNHQAQIARWLAALPAGCAVAMESTGRYHLPLARLALAAGMRVYVLNARDVYFYAKALGMRGKTDRTDAQVIARYVAEHHDRLHPWSPGTALQQRIQELVRRRNGVTTHRAALRELLEQVGSLQPCVQQLNAQFELLLLEIDRQIELELQSDQELSRRSNLLRTITGIGPVGSALLAALLSRIPFANADALVAYSGLDPRPNDSGQKRGVRKLSKHGACELRRQMYLAGFAAAHSKALKPLYQAIRDRGFKPTEAFVILGRKLLRVAWAVWNSEKPFDAALLVRKTACVKT
jgi:transposase